MLKGVPKLTGQGAPLELMARWYLL